MAYNAGLGSTKDEIRKVENMSSSEIDETAGPSGVNQLDAGATSPASRESVQWQSGVKGTETQERQLTRTDSGELPRRQSLMGTSGYVSQLLEEYLVSNSKSTEDVKPIRKQSLAERRASIRAVGEDIKSYMQAATYPKSEQSSNDSNIKKLSSALKTPASKAERIKEKTMQDEEYEPIPLLDESRPSSEWIPSHIREEEVIGVQKQRCWLGTYIVGKDYWAEKENNEHEKPETVSFSIDEVQKPWYDMPTKKPSLIDSAFRSMKLKSKENLDVLNDELNKEYEEKRKKRIISAAHAREQSTTVDEEWSEEFKQCFEDVARTNNFSHRGTHISMTDADKWLEKAEFLDHGELTLVHTALFFSACGGSRHRGLSFDEFTQFLDMISHTRSMPLRDIVRSLTVCQRNPEDYELKN